MKIFFAVLICSLIFFSCNKEEKILLEGNYKLISFKPAEEIDVFGNGNFSDDDFFFPVLTSYFIYEDCILTFSGESTINYCEPCDFGFYNISYDENNNVIDYSEPYFECISFVETTYSLNGNKIEITDGFINPRQYVIDGNLIKGILNKYAVVKEGNNIRRREVQFETVFEKF